MMTHSTRSKFRLALFGTLALTIMLTPAFAIELREQSGVAPLRPKAPVILQIEPAPGKIDPRVYPQLPQLQRGGSGLSINHTQWCASHYSSYRQSDNSYQPVAGIRQSCISPFH